MYKNEHSLIIRDLMTNENFKKLKSQTHHHNSNRFDHSVMVSYYTYLICKKLNLDYISASRAALLHDFFFDKEFISKKKQLFTHAQTSLRNASYITNLSKKEENIIASHMYPIGGTIPKSLESIVVVLVDDFVSLKEKFYGDYKYLKTAVNFLFIVLLNTLLK